MANQVVIDGEVCFGSTNKASAIIYKDKQGNEFSLQTVLDNLINYIYPVGSIYISINEVSPAVLFGGTWEKIENRFLLAAGSDYATGSIGGEAEHILTVDEIPSHKHTMTRQQWYSADEIYAASTGTIFSWKSSSGGTTSAGYRGKDMDDTGGSQAHNNMPPYLVVNIWKRTG